MLLPSRRFECRASCGRSELALWQTARPPSGRACKLNFKVPFLLRTPRPSGRLRLTAPSSGRRPASCAVWPPPLMSNVRRLVLSLCKISVAFGNVRRSSGAPSAAAARKSHVRTLPERGLIVLLGNALANRTAASGQASRRGFEFQSRRPLPCPPSRLRLTIGRADILQPAALACGRRSPQR